MRTKIIAEGIELDLDREIDAAFTYAIADISQPDKRDTSFSKTITIPGTSKNNQFFGSIFDLDVSNDHDPLEPNRGFNFNASKAARVIIYVDECDIFPGIMRLMKVITIEEYIEYEVVVFGSLGGIFASMAEQTIQDLDFTDLNHIYDLDTIVNSWQHTHEDGYVYPFIDYGYSQDNEEYPLKNFKPAVFAKTVWDKIFETTGYRYQSNFINSDLFKKLIITHAGGDIKHAPDFILTQVDKSVLATMTVQHDLSKHMTRVLSFGQETDIGGLFNGQVWTADKVRKVKIAINYKLTTHRRSPTDVGNTYIRIEHSTTGGASWVTLEEAGITTTNKSPTAPDYIDDVLSHEIEVGTGDKLRFVAQTDDNQVYTQIRVGTEAYVKILDQDINVVEGDEVQLAAALPSMLQKDVIRSFITAFNLYIEPDEFDERLLIIDPYPDYYETDKSRAINWSEKVDVRQPIETIPLGGLDAKTYIYGYKEDSDEYNKRYKDLYGEIYGDRQYIVDNDFVKDKKEVRLTFSPTPLVQHTTNRRIASCIYKLTEGGLTKEPHVGNPRLLIYTGMLPSLFTDGTVAEYSIVSENDGTLSFQDYAYAGHLDNPYLPTVDINFGAPLETFFTITGVYPSNSLFNAYYSNYLGGITGKDSKMVTVKARLTPLDIMRLNFRRMVFVFGSYFRINKIKDYRIADDSTTEIELLKINNI